MAVSWRFRALDAARKLVGGSIATMTLEDIKAARRSHLPELPIGGPVLERVGQALFGRPRPAVTISETTVGGAEGDLPARVHTPPGPARPRPLIVHYHGGGWTTGGPLQYDWICSSLAEDVDAVVVSVDYRKAPEHPAPAAYDDAVAAFHWLSGNRDAVGAAESTAVLGDSAGGNLAALVAIAARDEGLRLDAQVLIYPGVDLTLSFPSVDRLAHEPILSRADVEAFRAHYLSGGVAPDDPRVSPWFVGDVHGLAPALVQTAEHDPLVDEGDAYAGRLAEAGIEVRHTRYVEVPHGFLSLPGVHPAARQAVAEETAFLRAHL